MSLAALAAFAVNNNNRAAKKTPLFELPVADARKLVKIKDGNRKPAADGSQALTLTLGRRTLPLDIISKGASRVNAAAAQVTSFINVLNTALQAGEFDDVIAAAQAESKPVPEAVAPVAEEGTLSLNKDIPQSETVVSSDEGIEGLDFSGIE